jgi:hypothetical protein
LPASTRHNATNSLLSCTFVLLFRVLYLHKDTALRLRYMFILPKTSYCRNLYPFLFTQTTIWTTWDCIFATYISRYSSVIYLRDNNLLHKCEFYGSLEQYWETARIIKTVILKCT